MQSTVNRLYLPNELPSASPEPQHHDRGRHLGNLRHPALCLVRSRARATSKVDPAEALRSSAKSSAMLGKLNTFKLRGHRRVGGARPPWYPCGRAARATRLFGCAILMLGLTLLVPLAVKLFRMSGVSLAERVLGILRRIALDNVERSLGRSSVTVVALMLAVGMSMTGERLCQRISALDLRVEQRRLPRRRLDQAGSPLLDLPPRALRDERMDKLKAVPGI